MVRYEPWNSEPYTLNPAFALGAYPSSFFPEVSWKEIQGQTPRGLCLGLKGLRFRATYV